MRPLEEPLIERRITNYQAGKKVAYFASPVILSRLTVAGYQIGCGLVFKKLGPSETAAGPLITAITFAVIGTMRAVITPTGILVGTLNGANEFAAVGDMVRKSWVYGVMLYVPSLALLLNLEPMLKSLNIDADVAEAVQNYFTTLSYGIPPILWMTSDQQFTIGIKKGHISLGIGALYAILTIILGVPLALGSELGIKGLAHGTAVAGWLSLFLSRMYFKKRADFDIYNLFEISLRGISTDFSKLAKMGVFFGIQNLTEWGNLFAISLLAGKISKKVLTAESVSVQALTTFNVALFGLTQSTGVLISNYLGKAKRAADDRDDEMMEANIRIAYQLGNASIVLGLSASVITSAFIFGLADEISSIFISSDNPNYEEISALSHAMLYATAFGIIADALRNTSTGVLSGYKDVMFAPLVSIFFMSILGLTAGALSTFVFDFGPNSLFITRDIGLFVAGFTILNRWRKLDYQIDDPQAQAAGGPEAFVPPQQRPNLLVEEVNAVMPAQQPIDNPIANHDSSVGNLEQNIAVISNVGRDNSSEVKASRVRSSFFHRSNSGESILESFQDSEFFEPENTKISINAGQGK